MTRAQARRAGSPHYTAGRPCHRGHRAPRLTSNGHCTACHCRRDRLPGSTARLRRLYRDRLYQALRRDRLSPDLEALLGCTLPELRARLAAAFLPGMSWDNYGEWHVDHRVSLASLDLSDPAQLAAALHHANLRPLWAVDNLKKGHRPAP